jgi:hypothetical protein
LTEKWGKNEKRENSGILNPINTELNPICHLLALLEAHHILHISRKKVKSSAKKINNVLDGVDYGDDIMMVVIVLMRTATS